LQEGKKGRVGRHLERAFEVSATIAWAAAGSRKGDHGGFDLREANQYEKTAVTVGNIMSYLKNLELN